MMVHPQSQIEQAGKIIGKYGCLAMCYLYCAGVEPDELKYYELIRIGMEAGVINKEDCSVLNADKFIFLTTGKKARVIKRQGSRTDDLMKPTPVKFYCPGITPHWIVMEKGKVVFNSLAYSISVDKGQPVDARIIDWED